jgi:hypothetical protein
MEGLITGTPEAKRSKKRRDDEHERRAQRTALSYPRSVYRARKITGALRDAESKSRGSFVPNFLFKMLDDTHVCHASTESACDDSGAKELAQQVVTDLLEGGGRHHGMTICVSDLEDNDA